MPDDYFRMWPEWFCRRIENSSPPTNNGDAANKKYVDDENAKQLNLTGGTMTGDIDLGNNKLQAELVKKADLSTVINGLDGKVDKDTVMLLDGSKAMTGDMDMGEPSHFNSRNKQIKFVGDPTDPTDCSTKRYVDNHSSRGVSIRLSNDLSNRVKPFKLIFDFRKHYYSSRFGINIYQGDKSEYTVAIELWWKSNKIDHNTTSLSAASSVETVSRQLMNRFLNYVRSIVHMTKWSDTSPNYLMVDVVFKNKSGMVDYNRLDIWVDVYGSKGYHNDLPVKDVWEKLYSKVHNCFIHFNAPLMIDPPKTSLSPTPKHYVDEATRKRWYRGKLALYQDNRVEFYVNGTSGHTSNVHQRDNADFTVNYSKGELTEDRVNELKTLYKFYHKKYWTFKTMHRIMNRKHIIGQVTSVGLVATGTIVGGVTLNPIILGSLQTLIKHGGTFVTGDSPTIEAPDPLRGDVSPEERPAEELRSISPHEKSPVRRKMSRFREILIDCVTFTLSYSQRIGTYLLKKMPFRWPNTCQDVMLTTEVAQRRPRCPADYEEIARVLSPIFLEDKKPVVLSWRACRERMNGLISKYLEEDKKALKRIRSGTEEEYSELIQLLEDINTFRKDMEDEAKKAYETKRRKEKDDREKGEEMREAALIGMAKRENATSSSSSENSSSDESSKENEASAITSKPAKGQKNKKRASKLTALEMLEEINKQKAVLKEKELEQRRLELEFQKRKYEDEAKERKERLDQELEERRLLFALLKDKF
ncbi:hypothetical protein AWC38_SpisGene20325 [Stylophora pistillata]|uniref:Uncharacterized protein n=1 Tax=Stylophora pistillata TaxID=50429 RepID=A0A2B4RGS6_STYPI|nr:hypothetical protein AWC38_SpisGene20325 [Stylophora pistillata]